LIKDFILDKDSASKFIRFYALKNLGMDSFVNETPIHLEEGDSLKAIENKLLKAINE
jgi:hypothetical protein